MSQKDKLNELQSRLSEIFEGIDDYYSQSILDELINRIDTTIDDFNKEFQSLVGNLTVKPKKEELQQNLLKRHLFLHDVRVKI
jgi:chaperonin cofactor prefoldin